MSKQLSNCCKAEIKLTGSPNHEDGFACVECGRIIGTPRTFVIGDIHGAHKALKQVLERARFDYGYDTLVSLGDIADGWTEVAECFEELFKIKNLVFVRGNHDQWLKEWFKSGKTPDVWTMQGGRNTLLSYEKHPELKEKHHDFLRKSPFYHLDAKNRLFVHAGFNPYTTLPMEEQDKMELMWNRDLFNDRGLYGKIEPYAEVYVGHTTVFNWSKVPMNIENVWFMDTGAGWEGVLSLMDIDTKKVFQSDIVSTLYPNVIARGR